MAAILGEGKFFLKLPRIQCSNTCGLKILTKSLYLTVKEIEANLCFAKIQNGRHFWGGENFLKIGKSRILRYLRVENFAEIALSRTVKAIEAN